MPNDVTKLTPHTDGKRRIMHMKKLTAVALTARGANPDANVTFFKSKKTESNVDKHGDLADLLTSEEKGHQHGISVETYDGSLYINVMYAQISGDEFSHYHAIVSDGSGGFTMSANNGHTHTIEDGVIDEVLLNRLVKRENTITKEQAATLTIIKLDDNNEDDIMSKELELQLETMKTEFEKSKAALAVALAVGTFGDATKTYYNGLSDTDKELFIAKSEADRSSELEMAKSADPVVFKSSTGTEYRKSAGDAMINMAKQLDEQSKELTASSALVKNAEFQKRTATELPNVIGDDAHKVALLRAIDGIEDADTKKGALAILASANGLGETITTEFGTETPAAKTGESQVEVLVKKYVADKGVTEAEAYEKVLDTAAGQAAYNADVYNV